MYGLAIETALKVLSGAKVACTTQINAQIALTHGDETSSVPHPDLYIDQMVQPEGPPDALITGGMGPGYDPKTFKVDYPQ
jgi:ribose transport system substrate-binding protein